MVIEMDEAQVRTLEQVRQVLEGTQSLEFRRAEDDQGRYAWIESVLRRFVSYRWTCLTVHVKRIVDDRARVWWLTL